METPDDLGIAVAVPHLARVAAGVARPGVLDQKPGDGLPEPAVRLQRDVVLQPAVLGSRVSRGFAGQLHPLGGLGLPVLKAIKNDRSRVCWVWTTRNNRKDVTFRSSPNAIFFFAFVYTINKRFIFYRRVLMY